MRSMLLWLCSWVDFGSIFGLKKAFAAPFLFPHGLNRKKAKGS